jgi:hypothetical protein
MLNRRFGTDVGKHHKYITRAQRAEKAVIFLGWVHSKAAICQCREYKRVNVNQQQSLTNENVKDIYQIFTRPSCDGLLFLQSSAMFKGSWSLSPIEL